MPNKLKNSQPWRKEINARAGYLYVKNRRDILDTYYLESPGELADQLIWKINQVILPFLSHYYITPFLNKVQFGRGHHLF